MGTAHTPLVSSLAAGNRNPRRARRTGACCPAVRWLLPIAIAGTAGCHSRSTRSASPVEPPTDEATPVEYPRGRWRLAQERLDHVVLWVSDILIRHDGSDREVPFALAWNLEPPPPHRTRVEALRLANRVRARAAAMPNTFADLAREYSDDVVTRDSGGSVGGITATYARTEGPLLDALAVLKPGEISRVVETPHGYHVLLRRSPPPLATIAARRIVIDYQGAGSPGATPSKSMRSREEALATARTVSQTLRSDGGAFEALLAEFSSADVVNEGGDIGVWTNQEPGPFERERERLASMSVGEVSEPIDGREGVQIFLRTPVPADHREYVVRVLQIPDSSGAPMGAPSPSVAPRRPSDSAMADARSIIRTLLRAGEQWDVFERDHCCKTPERWSRGRTPTALVSAAEGLAIGGISRAPVHDPPNLFVIKRIDPAEAPVPPVLFDLPAPEGVDIARYASGSSGTAVQRLVRKLGDDAAGELGLSQEKAEQLKQLHDRLAESFQMRGSQDSREQALVAFRSDLRGALSPEEYLRYQQIAQRTVSSKVMTQW
jgi:hypothetical protein